MPSGPIVRSVGLGEGDFTWDLFSSSNMMFWGNGLRSQLCPLFVPLAQLTVSCSWNVLHKVGVSGWGFGLVLIYFRFLIREGNIFLVIYVHFFPKALYGYSMTIRILLF